MKRKYTYAMNKNRITWFTRKS